MKENPNYYSILPANVRYDDRLKANEKLLYSEITALANLHGYCYASNSYFAKLYGVKKDTVSGWINKLCKFGYLNTELIYRKNSREVESRKIYIISIPDKENLEEKYPDPISQKEDTPPINKGETYPINIGEGTLYKSEDNITRYNTTSINNLLHGGEEDDLQKVEKNINKIIEEWNKLDDNIPKLKSINFNTKRYKLSEKRLDEYGIDIILSAINKIKYSEFLKGYSVKSNFVINYDWFIESDNFVKVLEGNYSDKNKRLSKRRGKKNKTAAERYRERLERQKKRKPIDLEMSGDNRFYYDF